MPAPTLDAPYGRFVVSLISYAASFSTIIYLFPFFSIFVVGEFIVGMHVIIVRSCARTMDLDI